MSPVDNVRRAVALLRGEPAPEPHPVRLPPKMPDVYTAPLADLLELIADRYDGESCDDPTGVCNRCECDPTILTADLVADAVNGDPR